MILEPHQKKEFPTSGPQLYSTYLFRGKVLELVEFVKEQVFDALRSPAAHGARPQVPAERGKLAAEGDHLQLEHEPE